MKEVINLDDLSGIPLKIISSLQKHRDIFRDNEFLDEILGNIEIATVAQEIHEFCIERLVVGYHYTNAVPGDILKNGLTCRRGHEIREAFLKDYGNKFSEQEIKVVKEAWDRYFKPRIQEIRDNRLYFNFTKKELGRMGSELLLNYYGGEQVYWPLFELDGISDKINNIGKAMVLKCSLEARNLRIFDEYAYGKISISSYHSMINPESQRYDEDGYQFTDVMSENIEIRFYDGSNNI